MEIGESGFDFDINPVGIRTRSVQNGCASHVSIILSYIKGEGLICISIFRCEVVSF